MEKTFVIMKRDRQTGKSAGFVRKMDDNRLVAEFSEEAAVHVASMMFSHEHTYEVVRVR